MVLVDNMDSFFLERFRHLRLYMFYLRIAERRDISDKFSSASKRLLFVKNIFADIDEFSKNGRWVHEVGSQTDLMPKNGD